jgi:hypothetical protein
MNWKQPFTILLLILVFGVICYLLGSCPRKETTQTIKYIKGQTKVEHVRGKSDTVIKEKPIFINAKSTVVLKHDTVHHYHTASDTVQVYPYTLLIKDTVRDGKIDRDVIMTGYDSTFFITRVDTVKSLRVDTLVIEKRGKLSKVVIAVAFGGGYVLGFGSAVLAK